MTAKALIDLLSGLPPDMPVMTEQRYKTGYDEGDIYHCIVESVSARKGQVIIVSSGCTLMGGW